MAKRVHADIGDTLEFSVEFTDDSDAAADPTTVTLMLKAPDGGTETTYTYPANITKDATGQYSMEWICTDDPGWWSWRWKGVGGLGAADEGEYKIKDSAFDTP
jgi:hypothetical protein